MSFKILATLGPSSLNEETVRACADAGVGLFRINLSHTPVEKLEPTIRNILDWTDVPLCLDSEGAQMRNHAVRDEAVTYREGAEVFIPFEPAECDAATLSFSPTGVARHFEPGDLIRVDFDHVEFKVTAREDAGCRAVVVSGGRVGSRKAADMDRELPLPAITDKDRTAIQIGLDLGLRHFALSFANSAEDVHAMRALVGEQAIVMCKIESRAGLLNLRAVIDEADEVIIDRGDLSRQVPIEKIPFLQRRIISTARAHRKPIYVATNLLESMIVSKAPNRAEVNDVVSTIEMGADGLVLAAETAIGANPVGAVRMIRTLLDESERWTPYSTLDDILGV